MAGGRRHGDEIVAVLQRLGTDVYHEDEEHYYVARGLQHAQAIRKWLIPKQHEQHIVESLGYTMTEYADAIRLNEIARATAQPIPIVGSASTILADYSAPVPPGPDEDE